MKKIIISGILIAMTSCNVIPKKGYDTIYVSKKIDKMIHNLDVMEDWLNYDINNKRIPLDIANNYYIVIENTRESLIQLQTKYNKQQIIYI